MMDFRKINICITRNNVEKDKIGSQKNMAKQMVQRMHRKMNELMNK